jgi:small subunit ribosomal protein S24e
MITLSEMKVKLSEKAEGVVEKRVKNSVIGREELTVRIYHIGGSTPSRKELRNAIASLLQSKEGLVVVRKIDTPYGAGYSLASVHVYDSEETMKRMELKHILDRDAGTKSQKGGKKNG